MLMYEVVSPLLLISLHLVFDSVHSPLQHAISGYDDKGNGLVSGPTGRNTAPTLYDSLPESTWRVDSMEFIIFKRRLQSNRLYLLPPTRNPRPSTPPHPKFRLEMALWF